MLMRKLRLLTARIRYLSSHDAEERLSLFLEDQFGRKAELTPQMSKKDMAAAIGITPEAFSRLLLRLRKSGKLEWSGKRLRISHQFWR